MQWMSCNCAGQFFAIIIDNSNAAIDDNFDVILNGTNLGNINNFQNFFTGRIFAASGHETDLTPDLIGSPFPNPNAFGTTLPFDTALFITGTNTLQLVVTQNNGNGNFGDIIIAQFQFDNASGTYLEVSGTRVFGGNYNFPSGPVGTTFTQTFTYP